MCILGPQQQTFPSSGDLVGEALHVHLHLVQAQLLPFFNPEKCPHVPAHGAVLLAAGNHLERQGSALPPAGHPLGPVSITLRRREVFLVLFWSCSPHSLELALGMHRVKELFRAGETQTETESSWHKVFAGSWEAGVCQHHQQQQRWPRGLARCLHGSSCKTILALSANSLT